MSHALSSSELGGRLRIVVQLADGRVHAVRVQSTRPQAARLLVGRPPDAVAALLPRLFSLCGRAQAAVGAAALSVAGAAGGPVPDDWGVRTERVQEHVWRLLVDWPKLLGLTPQGGAFVRWYRRLAEARPADAETLAAALAAFLADAVFGGDPAAWLAGAGRGAYADLLLAAVSPLQGEAAPVRCLPGPGAAQWAVRLAALPPGFAASPIWDGAPAETGALARQRENARVAAYLARGETLAARLAARLGELAQAPDLLRQRAAVIDAAAVADGVAVACVETARGVLIHRVALTEGRVGDYQVIAPTEWNFPAAGGALAQLAGTPAGLAEARVRALVLALDPCVPVTTEFEEYADA